MSLWLSHQATPQNCFSSTKEAAYSALAEVGAQRKPTKLLFLWQDTNHLWLFLSELNWDPLLCFLLSQNAMEKNLNLEEQSPHTGLSHAAHPYLFKHPKEYIHLLSQNGCLCAAQLMSISHEIQRAGHCHPEMEHKKQKDLKLSLVVSGSRDKAQLLRCLTSMHKVLGSIPTTA